ncbi:MAG: SCO family protein [Candidatus Eremiobacteraeota bacterium]|nr:SCO family protein [Candidatus Eremiobacteraeota bacterium]
MALLGSFLLILLVNASPARAHETTLHGLVLATVPQRAEVIVRHGPLFGKPAGITTFRVVSAAAFRRLRAGETIDATADGDSTPWTLDAVRGRGVGALTGATVTDDRPRVLRDVHHVVVGEYAPTPQLLDERGRTFSLRDLRGQSVVMAFVYSRCKDARECPLITAHFAALQQKLRGAPVHLVEVTLDPTYDRPAVLARYGATFGQDPSRWTLATGDPETVLDFAAQFDVTAFPDERVGLIHPERLVLLDKYGAIRNLIDEGAWTPDEVLAEVQHDERLASNPFERLDLWLSSAAVAVCGNAVAGFSGFTDLLTVVGISVFFTFLLWRLGRFIARGAT